MLLGQTRQAHFLMLCQVGSGGSLKGRSVQTGPQPSGLAFQEWIAVELFLSLRARSRTASVRLPFVRLAPSLWSQEYAPKSARPTERTTQAVPSSPYDPQQLARLRVGPEHNPTHRRAGRRQCRRRPPPEFRTHQCDSRTQPLAKGPRQPTLSRSQPGLGQSSQRPCQWQRLRLGQMRKTRTRSRPVRLSNPQGCGRQIQGAQRLGGSQIEP